MNVTITGKNIEVTSALRAYVTSKLNRVLTHYADVTSTRIILAVDNETEKDRRNHVSVNFHQPGKESHISTEHADMYSAIDELMRKFTTFLERHKGKHLDHHSHDVINSLAVSE
jgi:putative sigma-54 modulation protein